MDEVFKGDRIVILECGLAWFESLRTQYADEIMSLFISPFSEE